MVTYVPKVRQVAVTGVHSEDTYSRGKKKVFIMFRVRGAHEP